MNIFLKNSIKLFAFIFFSLLAFISLPKVDTQAFSGGTGTIGDPYQISTPVELDSVRNYLGVGYTDTYFVLTNDIDLNVSPYNIGAGWVPIGTGTSTTRFYGYLDGAGFAVQNLYINSSSTYLGLFGASIGEIKDLGVETISVTGSNTGSAVYVAGLIGRNYGIINNCYVTGTLAPSGWVTGGMIGENVNGGEISNSYSTVTVNTSSLRSGGLVGQNFGSIDLSYATGNITSPTNQIGGLVGISYSTGSITNSYSTGNVVGDSSIGGLIGANERPISNSYATGNVTSSSSPGGLAGSNSSTVTNCYATGNINSTGGWYGGGLLGSNSSGGIVTYSYSTGAVTSIYSGGGLIGSAQGSTSNSYWDTETSGFSTSNGGVGKTTLEMQTQSTYVGWDFSNLWFIQSGNNNDYPYFDYQGYALPNYNLTYTSNVNGSLTGTLSQSVEHGSDGSAVTAVADANYHFVEWNDSSTDNPRTDLSASSDIAVSASFAIDTYDFVYTAGGNGSLTGTTTQTIDFGNDGSSVTAVADANYHFVEWSDSSTDNPRTDLSASSDIAVSANFTIDTYDFVYTAGGNGSLTGTTTQTIDFGNDGSSVTAVADANYYFTGWSDGITDNPRIDLNASTDITVTAEFTINTFALTYTSGVGGSLWGITFQTVAYASNGSSITATALSGYEFIEWSDGSTDNPRMDLNVIEDITVSAVFAEITPVFIPIYVTPVSVIEPDVIEEEVVNISDEVIEKKEFEVPVVSSETDNSVKEIMEVEDKEEENSFNYIYVIAVPTFGSLVYVGMKFWKKD